MFIWRANFEVHVNMPLTMIEKVNVGMALVRQDVWSMLFDIHISHRSGFHERCQAVSAIVVSAYYMPAEFATQRVVPFLI